MDLQVTTLFPENVGSLSHGTAGVLSSAYLHCVEKQTAHLVSHQDGIRLQMRGTWGRNGEARLPALPGPHPAHLEIPGSLLDPGLGVMEAS